MNATKCVCRTAALSVLVAVLAPESRVFAQCPWEEGLDEKPASSHWLEGTIGPGRVRMHLQRGGAVVVGVYYYTQHWAPLLLQGEWLGEGELRLTEETEVEQQTGTIQGLLRPSGFEGQWTSPDGQKKWPVRLGKVPAPRCDGKEPWRTFDDPGWPVTFSYPGSWRLDLKNGALTVTCPDPAAMMYAGSEVVLLQQGTGLASFDSGDHTFSRCGSRWILQTADQATCSCEDTGKDFCKTIKPTQRAGMTVLAGGGDVRLYCRGAGYRGLGSREERLFLIGDRWFTLYGTAETEKILKRIETTVRPRSPAPTR